MWEDLVSEGYVSWRLGNGIRVELKQVCSFGELK